MKPVDGKARILNLKELKEIMKILQDSDVAEMEIELEGLKIRLKRLNQQIPSTQPNQMGVQSVVSPAVAPVILSTGQAIVPSPSPAVEVEALSEVKSKSAVETTKQITITAPMVGTFYRASTPDTEPYVNEGTIVSEGQTICIIEAMKLMNEIKAEIKGKIVKILVENSQPVEYGQPLFLVEPI